ncbi:NACHT, LRR and PYD domains-containing protein 3-like [Lissotriton helveticus]
MEDRGSTSGDVLLYALQNLYEADFKTFKNKLSEINFKGERNIPQGILEKADQIDTKNLLVQYYGSDSAIDVTIEAFSRVSLMEPAARLREERQRVLDPHEAREFPGTTSDYRDSYMKHIAERYRLIEDRNARVGETVLLQKRYTKLLIVQKHRHEEERQHEIMSRGREHTEIMDVLARKHYIGLDALFTAVDHGHRPRTVVLQGPAGIGKTMTAQKIMLDWALGKLYQELFDYVFYLSCREINQVRSSKSVTDVIAAGCPNRTVPRSALLAGPSKILLILDGFDELKFSLDLKKDQLCTDPSQRNPVEVTLSNLLRRNILPGCSMIITTRPTALTQLRQCIKPDLCAEIMGFTEEDRKLYFKGYFDDNKQASRALAVVQDNDTLYTMCFLPIVCWIVCTVMKQQMERGQDITNSSKTTTSVYLFFLSTLLRDHSDASAQTRQRSLKKFCSLALNGIFEQRILFDEEDLQQFGLEVLDIQSLFLNQTIFQQDIGIYSAYSFIHLSFQEFFAALFYIFDLDVESLNPQRDLKHLLKEYSEQTKGHLMLTVRFLCGLINKDHLRHVEKVLGCKTSPSTRADLVAWLQEPKEERLLLDVFHCLHETQDEEFISRAMNNIQNINPTGAHCTMIDFKALSFCLKHCQGDKTLIISNVHFGPKLQEIMRPGMINCSSLRTQEQQMEKIIMSSTGTSEKPTFQKDRVEEYTHKELKQFCKELHITTTALSTKEDFQKALTAWVEAGAPLPPPEEDGGEEGPQTETSGQEGERTYSLTRSLRAERGLSPEEMTDRERTRIHELELARLKIGELKLAEKKLALEQLRLQGELEEKKLQREHEGKKLQLEHERSLKELELKARSEDTRPSGNRETPSPVEAKVHIPKDVVKEFYKGDDIQQWFKAYEVAITSHRVPEKDWGAGLWGRFLSEGRDTMLDLPSTVMNSYTHMKDALLSRYGLTPEIFEKCSMRDEESLPEPGSTDEERSPKYWCFNCCMRCKETKPDMSALCAVLKDPRSSLRELSLFDCGITSASYATLAVALRSNRSLLDLDLGANKLLGDAGATLICDALKEPDTRLQKIRLFDCSITSASCAALAAALRSSRSLLDLDLSVNPLGDAGGTLICDALKHPDTRLQKISLSECGLTAASCAALASSLSSICSLLDLVLSHNSLGDAGATLIIDTLKEPDTRLQKICLSECGITGTSCAALAAALRSNCSLLDLDLGYNALGVAGVSLICDALKHPDTRLQKIRLHGCSITGASGAALAAALRSNRSLLELDLSLNDLSDAGATLIWDALKHPDTRLQKIRDLQVNSSSHWKPL